MAWGGKYHCRQPVPDSFRKPAGFCLLLGPTFASHQPCLQTVPLRSHIHPSWEAWKGMWRPLSTHLILILSFLPGLFYGTKPTLYSESSQIQTPLLFPGAPSEYLQSPAYGSICSLSSLSPSLPVVLADPWVTCHFSSPVGMTPSPLETE